MVDLANILFDNFGKVITLLLITALAIIAIFKVNLKLDLNNLLGASKIKNRKKAQHYCAHMEFRKIQNNMVQVSFFESPSGTNTWLCNKCGLTIQHFDQERQESDGTYWLEHPDVYRKNIKKYNYHAKKSL